MHFMHIKHVSTNTKFVVFDFYENKHTHNLCVVGTDTHADHKLNRIDTFRHCIWHILLAYGHTSYRIYSIHNYYTRFFLLLFVDFSVMINILVLILIRFEKKMQYFIVRPLCSCLFCFTYTNRRLHNPFPVEFVRAASV